MAAPRVQIRVASRWWGNFAPGPLAVNLPQGPLNAVVRGRIQNLAGPGTILKNRAVVYVWRHGNDCYVGETSDFEARCYQHINDAFNNVSRSPAFYSALSNPANPPNTWTIYVLDWSATMANINPRQQEETRWILRLASMFPNGLNTKLSVSLAFFNLYNANPGNYAVIPAPGPFLADALLEPDAYTAVANNVIQLNPNVWTASKVTFHFSAGAKYFRIRELKRLLAGLEPDESRQLELLEDTYYNMSGRTRRCITHERPSMDDFMAEFKLLPGGYANYRKPAIAALLTRWMNPHYVARQCGIPYTSLKNYVQQLGVAEQVEEKRQQATAAKQQPAAPPTEKRKAFTDWSRLNAPVKSGTLDSRFLKWSTFVEAHQNYVDHSKANNVEFAALNTFILYCRQDRIKRQGWDRYLCDTCCDAKQADARGEELEQYMIKHLELIPTQWQCWKEDIESLETDHSKLVAVHDFSTIHESAGYKMRVMSIVLFYYDEEEQEVVRSFFDYASDHGADWAFVRYAWKEMKKEFGRFRDYDTIVVWSDNGLKSKENLFYFYKWADSVSKELKFELKYWAPQHGHSECDRHFGQLKHKIRRQYAGHYIAKDEDALDQIVELARTIPGTQASAGGAKEISDKSPAIEPFEGIRSYFWLIKLDEDQYEARTDCTQEDGIFVTMATKR